MAGVQIDGVNNKIDFDDDLDTSISANTDDTLVIEAGGNTMATITATTFTINDGTTITTADNTDTLTLISTDADATQGPVLNLYRNSSAVEDDNDIARINFTGNDSGGNATTYASTRVIINDVTDGTEDTQIIHSQMIGGAFVSTLRCKPDEIVINDSSIDLDFRVESDGRTHAFVVDAGTNTTMIGTNQTDFNAGADDLIIGTGSGDKGITIYTGSSVGDKGSIFFADGLGATDVAARRGQISYEHNNELMTFFTNDTEAMRIHLNQVISASAGIALGVGTANTASNVLDDYEEGTWSVPNGAVNGITFSVTSVAGNTYTKIGRQVTINANMTFGTHTSDGNQTYLGSLPFTPLSGGTFVGKVRTSANITGCCVEINGGESFIRLMKDSGGTYDYVSRAESRDQRMEFTISYLV